MEKYQAYRLAILRRFDVGSFQFMMKQKTGEEPERHVAIAAMHKARVKLGVLGYIDKKRATDSERWLKNNGHWDGTLDTDGQSCYNSNESEER